MAMNTTIGRRYVASLDEILTREYASASEAIHAASMRAVQIVGSIAEHGAKDEVRLKAASDLLDRNPATSKTQRMELEAFTLGAKDVQALAESLVKGKQLHSMFPEAANGNYIKTETFKAITPGETDAEV